MFRQPSINLFLRKQQTRGEILVIPTLWDPNVDEERYKNPIIHADYSDPDVIRVGSDYFLVASSFNCVPGLPILHSRDLINWKIVNYAVERLPSPEYDTPQIGKGIWAPAIRYHEEKFYIYFSMPDDGIYVCYTDDPFGKWSDIHLVKAAKGWIDPCPFWDEDGNAYLVNAFAKSRIGFNSKLCVSRLSADGLRVLDEGKIVFDGAKTQPTIEGPKLYKRNGYYYIFAPAGGVKFGWQTVLRSKDIYGPYEEKIVLHQGKTKINGPHQGAWVETEKGEHWFVHFQDRGPYGRVVHLQPMRWEDNWPVIGVDIDGDGIGEPVEEYRKPNTNYKNEYDFYLECSDHFDKPQISLQWQWHANPQDNWYSLEKRKSYLRLYAVGNLTNNNKVKSIFFMPNLLLQKIPAPEFIAIVKLEVNFNKEGSYAGIIMSGSRYSSIGIKRGQKKLSLVQVLGDVKADVIENTVAKMPIETSQVFLKISVKEGAVCKFSFSFDGKKFTDFGTEFIPQEAIWVGSKIGLFCINTSGKNGVIQSDYADFDYFKIENFRKEDEC